MNHSAVHSYENPGKYMASRSEIAYLLQEKYTEPLRIAGEGTCVQKKIEKTGGRLVISQWVKMDIHNTGVNVLMVLGEYDGTLQKVLQLDTEGAYFYAYDGQKKQKLCHFQSDDWYSIYVSVNLQQGVYSLYIDGERMLHRAGLFVPAKQVEELWMGSHGGVMYVGQLSVYPNTVPAIEQLAQSQTVYHARKMGVEADGETLVTRKLQEIVDTCSTTGGIVYLEGGTFLSGMLELKKNVTLYIEENATLKGTLDLEAYPVRLSEKHPNWNTIVQGPQKALLFADDQENIRLCGGGTIDGSGDFPGAYGSESLRVSAILLVGCPNVEICDLYVKDAGMWTIPLVECDDLYLHDINIDSTWYPNRDGIDLCDCYDVLVENCNIKADDDAMCFKSGNESGCDNTLVRNCFIISTMANGIKFGTYSYGGFTNCICEDCIIKDTRTCAISIQSVDGGLIKNLQFRRIFIQNVESAFFILIGDKGRTPDWGQHRIGSVEEILFENIHAEGIRRSYGSYLGGYEAEGKTYLMKDITFRRVNAIYKGGVSEVPGNPAEFGKQYPESNCFGILPAAGYYMRHGENITFEDCNTLVALPDSREVYVAVDIKGCSVNGKNLS
ncbi:MAG: hypothetical protein IJ335_00795 [Lachnospiraceae bacterium]|nr:hypothetical protein [Lachnospiraceae bacterium]